MAGLVLYAAFVSRRIVAHHDRERTRVPRSRDRHRARGCLPLRVRRGRWRRSSRDDRCSCSSAAYHSAASLVRACCSCSAAAASITSRSNAVIVLASECCTRNTEAASWNRPSKRSPRHDRGDGVRFDRPACFPSIDDSRTFMYASHQQRSSSRSRFARPWPLSPTGAGPAVRVAAIVDTRPHPRTRRGPS